ncbi:MAG: quinol:cytochrome C oxidoreductase [Phycisphaerae bacterium]|nr:quinol:cytochrome C oxidoreductase [Phycisphaerae bacterium]
MSHAHSGAELKLGKHNIELGGPAASLQMAMSVLFAVGIGGAVAMLSTGNVESEFFWKSYLQNVIFVIAISLGGLFFVFVQHLTRAGWSVAVRRPAEILAANLRWIWVLFLPIAYLYFAKGQGAQIWPWADMATMRSHAPAEADLVQKKLGFFSQFGLFNGDFFWIRTVAYFVIWGALAHFFYSGSLKLGASGDANITRRMQLVAAPAAILFALSATFAAFDWMMSISPAWFSTMFGVYFFCGCCTVGFAALILTCVMIQSTGAMKGVITEEHYQDLGKLLFAFGMVFWAYIGFSQYMLIWYANLPEETGWFIARQIGDWVWVSVFLLAGHFIIPFLAFISKWPKRMPMVLAAGAAWMLFVGWIDLYWLIHPEVPVGLGAVKRYAELETAFPEHTKTHLLQPTNWLLLAGMVGLYGMMTIRELRRAPLVCVKDPRVGESLGFENM